MRLKLAILFALLPGILFGQVWEKFLAPGITYRMEVDESVPRIVHAVRFSLKSSDVQAAADIGRPTILADDPLKGRKTVSDAVAQAGAIGGINADFFPYTGDPLGLMVRNGELLSSPNPLRSVLAWGGGEAAFGKATWSATLTPDAGTSTPIDGLNEQCGVNQLVVDAPVAGLATATTKAKAVFAVVKVTGGTWTPQGKLTGELQVVYEVPSMPVPAGDMVLVATGTKAATLKSLTPGAKLSVQFNVTGFDWTKYRDAVGGGPDLVRGGQIQVDGVAQGFSPSAFINKRHPRSAVGRTVDGDLWFVVVDGRQKMSDGASLVELAKIMSGLGCVDAMNLDGGGSSCLNLFGLVLNRPSDGKERPVADMVLFRGRVLAPEPVTPTIVAPTQAQVGDAIQLSVKTDKGDVVPNAEVVWAAAGSGWIDQGGMLHCFEAGSVTVRALAKGHLIAAAIAIEAKAPVVNHPHLASPVKGEGLPDFPMRQFPRGRDFRTSPCDRLQRGRARVPSALGFRE